MDKQEIVAGGERGGKTVSDIVQTIHLGPRDVLLVRVHVVSPEHLRELYAHFQAVLPCEVLILDPGTELAVIHSTQENT